MSELVQLSEVVEFIRNGLSVKQSENAGGLPITRIETISHWEINPGKCGYAGLEQSEVADRLLREGDILFSHINSLEHLGKTAIYKDTPLQLVHGMNLLCIRPDKTKVLPSYLLCALRSKFVNSQVMKAANKSVNQASISGANLKKIKVQVPSIEEQKRISLILDTVDRLQEKRKVSLDMLETFLQSSFYEAFGDPVLNPKKWATSTLGDECEEIRNGYSVKQSKECSGLPISRIETISQGTLNMNRVGFADLNYANSSNYLLRHGDILFSHINSSHHLCKCAIYREEYGPLVHGMNLLRFRSGPRIEPLFLLYLIKSESYRNSLMTHENPAVNQSSIAAGKLKTHPMPVPPMEAQREFASLVDSVELLRNRSNHHLKQLNELNASVQKILFEGWV